MSPEPINPDDNLRHRAEKRLKHMNPADRLPRIETSAQRLLHELHVHQIELEMQNEELRTSRAEQEDCAARYTDLYDFAPVGYFTLDRQGTMIQSNLEGAALLGAERAILQSRRFEAFVTKVDRAAFNSFLKQVFAKQPDSTCEVRLEGKDGQVLFVQINAKLAADRQTCRTVVTDITERMRADNTLRETLKALQSRIIDQTKELDAAKALESVLQKTQAVLEKRFAAQTTELRQSREDLATERGRAK